MVSTEDVIADVAALQGFDKSTLVKEASELLGKMRTDFKADEIIAFAKNLSAIGLDNCTRFDAVTTAETATAEDGTVSETGYVVIDKVQMGTAVGLLVAA